MKILGLVNDIVVEPATVMAKALLEESIKLVVLWQVKTPVDVPAKEVLTFVVLGYAAAELAPEVASAAKLGGVKLPV